MEIGEEWKKGVTSCSFVSDVVIQKEHKKRGFQVI